MFYQALSNEELQKYPYPNLIAEWRESGYSFCTLGDHMGLGHYRQEGDPEIWRKLKGEVPITADEAVALARLFGVKMSYLFDDELKMMSEMPLAYWHWYDSNKRREEEMRQFKERECIVREMREKPYLINLFRILVDFDEKKARNVQSLLVGMIGGAVA